MIDNAIGGPAGHISAGGARYGVIFMSNYLLIIATSSRANAVKTWMQRLAATETDFSADVVDVSINDHQRLLYIARNGRSDVDAEGQIFRGYALDFERQQLVFGLQGVIEAGKKFGALYAREPVEGCYFSVEWNGDRVLISNDLFGMCSLFSFAENDCVAFSDSVFLLSRIRKVLNLPRTVNSVAAHARAWGNAMAGQMLSPHSIVEEITFLPPGVTAEVLVGDVLRLYRRVTPLPELFSDIDSEPYGEALKDSARRFVSLIDALAGTGLEALKLSVSGGLDSRVCIAAALLSPAARQASVLSCINKSQQHATDYQVVSELSERFAFPLGSRSAGAPQKPRTRSIKHNLGFWFLASSGAYDFMVAPAYYSVVSDGFTVGGHGAETIKGNYGWRSVGTIADKIADPLLAQAFRQQVEYGISTLGVEANSTVGSEWHYLAYRNAIHSGRISSVSMVGFRPFQMRRLVALAHSRLSPFPRPPKGSPSVVNDLVIALQPDVAGHRYDDPHKNMTHDFIQERLKAIGGPLSAADITPFTVLGDQSKVSSGFSGIFKRMAEEDGLWTDAARGRIVELATAGHSKATDLGLGEVYGPVHAEAMAKLADASIPLNFTRGAAGKLLAFHLLG